MGDGKKRLTVYIVRQLWKEQEIKINGKGVLKIYQ